VGTSRTGAATGALVVASVLWGTTGTAASLLPGDVSPLATGASTMAVGGVLLFALAARPALSALADPAARRWLLIGAAGVVVYPLAFYSAMDQAGVAIGNVVALGSGPVFAALLEWLWERRGLSRRWLASTGIAVVGIALLSTGRHAAAGRC
jgi:DME family drug/metabolite transporter